MTSVKGLRIAILLLHYVGYGFVIATRNWTSCWTSIHDFYFHHDSCANNHKTSMSSSNLFIPLHANNGELKYVSKTDVYLQIMQKIILCLYITRFTIVFHLKYRNYNFVIQMLHILLVCSNIYTYVGLRSSLRGNRELYTDVQVSPGNQSYRVGVAFDNQPQIALLQVIRVRRLNINFFIRYTIYTILKFDILSRQR